MRFIRLKEVMEQTGLSRSTLYLYIEKGIFPSNVSLGGRCVAWVESEVLEWMENKIAERDKK